MCFLAFERFSNPPAAKAETSSSSAEALNSRFNSALKRSKIRRETLNDQYDQEAISEEEYADALETDVLPTWVELRKKVEEAENVPPADFERLMEAISEIELHYKQLIGLLRTKHWKKLEDHFQEMEKQTVARLQFLKQRLETGAVKESDFANELTNEILPRWKELQSDFLAAENIPAEFQGRRAALTEIIRLREAGWQARVEAIRDDQPAKHDEADKLLNEGFPTRPRVESGGRRGLSRSRFNRGWFR